MAKPLPPDLRGRSAPLVQQAMDTARVSINSLADQTGIPYSTLRRKITGHSDLTLAEVLVIAEALGLHPADLIPADMQRAVTP